MLSIGRKLVRSVRSVLNQGEYRCSVDVFSPTQLYGWVRQLGNDAPLRLKFVIDDRVIANDVVCDLYREDLIAAGMGTGHLGFRVQIPADLAPASLHTLTFVDSHTDKVLATLSLPMQTSLGNIDGRTCNILSGWCRSLLTDVPLNIDVLVGEAYAATAIPALIQREDVKQSFGGNGLCGFRVDLSSTPLWPDADIIIRNSDTGAVIIQVPVREVAVLGTPSEAEASLEKLLREPDLHAAVLRHFDAAFYTSNTPAVVTHGLPAFQHFMTSGWHECLNPSPDFDIIWYTHTYLKGDWTINALLHYAAEGEKAGHLTRPPVPVTLRPGLSYEGRTTPVRRVCLFAGYDADGVIDPVVTEYVTELARFADVYYLADCHMPQSELDKLKGVTVKAWAQRHGRYDFGSWSLLAQDLVGWQTLETYDELILVNDSAYLVRPLDAVFQTMDARACDWWGLQASKGIASTLPHQALEQETPLEDIKSGRLSQFEIDPVYDFLLGSYFLTYRKPVLCDRQFQSILNGITEGSDKLRLIQKYEIGLTRFLISKGYEFDTFMPTVHPRQPVYTELSLDLVRDGFPLFKKFHLSENHYHIDELWRWPQWLAEAGVTKDLAPYIDNLNRTSDYEKRYHIMDVTLHEAAPPLSAEELRTEDERTPKYDDWWCFPVCAFSHLFNDNIRALFEEVKHDPTIRKIVLTRSKYIEVDGTNVVVLPLNSREGQYYLLRSRHIFIKHTVHSNLNGAPLSPERHHFHNLWHGIPLKRIGYASLDHQHRLHVVEAQNRMLRSVISASRVDQLAMASAFWPLTLKDVWLTGLPRHDLITKPEALLPEDMCAQLDKLRAVLNGRKLVLFAPTFRNDQAGGYYTFAPAEYEALTALLRDKGYVMGVREHMADKTRQYSHQLSGDTYIPVSEALYPYVETLMREASVLITDYSSIFIDFLITGRPVVSFAYDYDHYAEQERGLFYDLEWCFPGAVCKDFTSFFKALSEALSGVDEAQTPRYVQSRQLFIEHLDGRNSARVAERVRGVNAGDTTLFELRGVDSRPASGAQVLWIYDPKFEAQAKERIRPLLPELASMGWSGRMLNVASLTPKDVAAATIVVFYRVSATDNLMDMAEAAKRGGRTVVFDIDESVFDPEALMQIPAYRDAPENRLAMRQAAHGYRRLMQVADLVTVPTSQLKAQIEALGQSAVVIPSPIKGQSSETDQTRQMAKDYILALKDNRRSLDNAPPITHT